MLKVEVLRGPGGWVLLMDSITQATAEDAGAFVVSASHGGTSSGEFALAVSPRVAFFNDAGGGKDGAGIAALAMLQARGLAGGTVAHTSARIGDARDTWACGLISELNDAGRALGLNVGEPLQAALRRLIEG